METPTLKEEKRGRKTEGGKEEREKEINIKAGGAVATWSSAPYLGHVGSSPYTYRAPTKAVSQGRKEDSSFFYELFSVQGAENG